MPRFYVGCHTCGHSRMRLIGKSSETFGDPPGETERYYRCPNCNRSSPAPTHGGPRRSCVDAETPPTAFVGRLPLEPLQQAADRALRGDRPQQGHVIFAHVPLHDRDLVLPAALPDQIPSAQRHLPRQGGPPILGDPHQMEVNLEDPPRVRQ